MTAKEYKQELTNSSEEFNKYKSTRKYKFGKLLNPKFLYVFAGTPILFPLVPIGTAGVIALVVIWAVSVIVLTNLWTNASKADIELRVNKLKMSVINDLKAGKEISVNDLYNRAIAMHPQPEKILETDAIRVVKNEFDYLQVSIDDMDRSNAEYLKLAK